jgi:hypothetical protein
LGHTHTRTHAHTPIFRHTQNSPVGGVPGAGGPDSGGGGRRGRRGPRGGVAREGAGGGSRAGRRAPGGGHRSRYISRQPVQDPEGPPPSSDRRYILTTRGPAPAPGPLVPAQTPPRGTDGAGREGVLGARGAGLGHTPSFRQPRVSTHPNSPVGGNWPVDEAHAAIGPPRRRGRLGGHDGEGVLGGPAGRGRSRASGRILTKSP